MKPDWFEIFSIIAFPVCFFWLLKIVYDDGKESGIEQLKAENLLLKDKLEYWRCTPCEAVNDANKVLNVEIEQLKSKLEIAKKGLEFYADRNNWSDYPSSPHPESDLMYCMDYKFDETARQALKEINEG